MTTKTKKIIAREGLILLLVYFGHMSIGSKLCTQSGCIEVANIIVFAYIVFIVSRFIIWAIKTLMKKDKEE